MRETDIAFTVIGLGHPHVFEMARSLVAAGARAASYFPGDGEEAAEREFAREFPGARRAQSEEEAMTLSGAGLVVCASMPAARAAIGARAMERGLHFLSAKPAAVSSDGLALLRSAQAARGRVCSVYFSERFASSSTLRALELVAEGAIGRVVRTIGAGPHRLRASTRPKWFFDRKLSGGILCDLASHQFDQFLAFTGAESGTARIAAASTANHANPSFPEFEDYGEAFVRAKTADGNVCGGNVRVDWLSPEGLGTWGDVRLTVVGTEGFIEIRKNVDLAGRTGGDHLFLVDASGTRRVECAGVRPAWASDFLADLSSGTERLMTQAHCFDVLRLAVEAQEMAQKVEF